MKKVANVLLLATLWFFKTFFKDASLPNICLMEVQGVFNTLVKLDAVALAFW